MNSRGLIVLINDTTRFCIKLGGSRFVFSAKNLLMDKKTLVFCFPGSGGEGVDGKTYALTALDI